MLRLGKVNPRSASPITTKVKDGKHSKIEMVRNGKLDNQMKINRIPLIRSAIVHLLEVESPSAIWVRLTNHITEQLVVTDLYSLQQARTELFENEYYMAPYEDGKYSRCRLLKKKTYSENTVVWKVLFIDYGKVVWVNPNCLAVMKEDDLPFHPYQAILIAIAGVHVTNVMNKDGTYIPKWTKDDCDDFKEIMKRFELFRTQTLFGSVFSNNHREPVKVELFGMDDENDAIGVSIAHLFAAMRSSRVIPLKVRDVSTIPAITTYEEYDKDYMKIEKWRESWPKLPPKEENSANMEAEWENWTIESAQVPLLTVDYLRDNGFYDSKRNSFLLHIEGQWTKSPYEWYGRPIKSIYKSKEVVNKTESTNTKVPETVVGNEGEDKTKDTGITLTTTLDEFSTNALDIEYQDDALSMINGQTTLKIFANKLDDFYSNLANRSVLDRQTLVSALEKNTPVYAITSCYDYRAQYTGEWQRVQVMSAEDDYCIIRFLDSGGRETVVHGSLYKIHPTHCTYPPLCGQFCLHGFRDPNPENNPKEVKFDPSRLHLFKNVLRVDVPIEVHRIELVNEHVPFNTKHKVYEERHVFYVEDLRICGEGPVRDRLLNGRDSRLFPDEKAPTEW